MSIGQVTSVVGIVKAIDASGNERVLALGDDIFEGDTIVAAQGAKVEILMVTGDQVLVADGQRWSPTEETFNTAESIGLENQVVAPPSLDSLEDIQQALLSGQDVTQTAGATAAGATAAGGLDADGGAEPVSIARSETDVRDVRDFGTTSSQQSLAPAAVDAQIFPIPSIVSVTSSATVNTSVESGSVVEGGQLFYTVTLSNSPLAGPAIYEFTLGGGTATSSDYGQLSSDDVVIDLDNETITVPEGLTSFTLILPTLNDDDFESSETVPFVIDGVNATALILDNDQPEIQAIVISNSSGSVDEGGSLIYLVSLSAQTISAATYQANIAGTADSSDYTTLSFSNDVTINGDGLLTVPAGITRFTATLPTNDDTDVEATETVSFTIDGVAATGSILDNDQPTVMVSIVATEFSGSEGGLPGWALGTQDGADTVTLTGLSGSGANINSKGTAAADTITTTFYMDNSMFDTGNGADTVTITPDAGASSIANNASFYSGDGADTITINYTLNNSIFDSGKDGSGTDADTVTLTGLEAKSILLTRAGADTVTILSATQSAVFTGEDADTLTVVAVNASVINAGSGINTVTLTTVKNASCVKGGDESDTITINGVMIDSTLHAGHGINTVTIGDAQGSSSIMTGKDADTVTFGISSGNVALSTGGGIDTVTLTVVKDGFDGKVNLGSEVDTFTINMDTDAVLGVNAMFDGGDGLDTLNLTGVTKAAWDNGVKTQFVNFENVILNGITLLGSDKVFTDSEADNNLKTHNCSIDDWISAGVVFTVSRDLDNGEDSTVKFTLGAIAGSELEAADISKIVITDATGLAEITGLAQIQDFLTNGKDVKLSGSEDATVMLTPVSDSLIENIEAFSGNVETVANGNADISGTGTDYASFRDTLDGGEPDQMLIGDSSDNILLGGSGDDFIFGGLGDDQMTGGIGVDSFVFGQNNGIDTILDFDKSKGEKLDLSDLLTGENSDNLDDYLSFTQDGNDTLINVKTTGTGSVDHVIKLENLDLTNGSTTSDVDIINNLLANNLIIDY